MSGVAWFSGGAASAVACLFALQEDPECEIVFLDTRNEHEDLYRFMGDCEKWYGKKIERIADGRTPIDIWRKEKLFIMVGVGAQCSNRLKRRVRETIQVGRGWRYHAFGFDVSETRRARNMLRGNGELNPTFPLIERKYDKAACLRHISRAGIELPASYRLGFNNNNCLKTGCPQGGVGYWKHFSSVFPTEFAAMVDLEREISHEVGSPRTILRNAFLAHNEEFPTHKNLTQLRGKHIKPLEDCNGFCGIDDPMDNNLFGKLLSEVK